MKTEIWRKTAAVMMTGMLSLLCACIRTDYQEVAAFPPLPNDIKVVTYYDKSQFPAPENEQILVGNASARASSSSYTLNDIKQKLIRMARARGANALLILGIDHKLDGQVRTDQVKNLSAPTWTPVDDSSTDAQQQRYMDLYSSARDGELPVYIITIKAQFYKLPDQFHAKEPIMLSEPPVAPRREETPEKEPQIRIQERNTAEPPENKIE